MLDAGRMVHSSSSALSGLILLAILVVAPSIASAQGFFDLLFGRTRNQGSAPAQPHVYPEMDRSVPAEGSVSSVFYCVRLCDGRYFPINYSVAGGAAEICNSFCPASKTKIFSGSQIDFAVANDGRSYRDLPSAFVYRTKVIDGCTCDGKTAFGLASINIYNDATLRAGDIVAMPEGLMIATGRRDTQFIPISGEMRKRLAKVRVAPTSVSMSDGRTFRGSIKVRPTADAVRATPPLNR